MRRLMFWVTMASAAGAVYLMYKRGAPVLEIAQKALMNPVGTLVNEVKGSAGVRTA